MIYLFQIQRVQNIYRAQDRLHQFRVEIYSLHNSLMTGIIFYILYTFISKKKIKKDEFNEPLDGWILSSFKSYFKINQNVGNKKVQRVDV